MIDEELDEIYEKYGIDVRLAGGPDNPITVEPPLSSAGRQAQAELLQRLAAMRATIEMMECMVRDNPSDDRTFNIFDETLAQKMLEANRALQRLRERRECEGAA